MGIFDLFSTEPAEEAARFRQAAAEKGYGMASDLFGAGRKDLSSGFGQAQNLFSGLQQGTQAGSSAYADASGANGPEGMMRAYQAYTANPAMKSGFDLWTGANDRLAASRGTLGSGGTEADTAKYAMDYANKYFGEYRNALQPYLGANQAAVAGGANVATGLGTALNASQMAQGGLATGAQTAIGEAQAGAAEAPYKTGANELAAILGIGNLAAKAFGAGVGKASGGPLSSEWPTVVGEAGPEIVVPHPGQRGSVGTVIPNNVAFGGQGRAGRHNDTMGMTLADWLADACPPGTSLPAIPAHRAFRSA